MLLYKEPEEQAEAETKTLEKTDNNIVKKIKIASPLKGKVIKLADMKDEAFASGVLGKGAAIVPEEGKVYAPADGEITALFPTLHAMGIKTDEGAELLIHIGLDTVQLNGEGFEAHIKDGDRIQKGQLLISFDKALLESKGYCLETPVLVTNSEEYLEVAEMAEGNVMPGDDLLKVLR